MGIFDEDDGIEDIFRSFFGHSPLNEERERRERNFISSENDERNMDFVEDGEKTYLIFELPVINEKDILVNVKGNLLNIKAGEEEIVKNLPKNVKAGKFDYTFKNGILEVSFAKK